MQKLSQKAWSLDKNIADSLAKKNRRPLSAMYVRLGVGGFLFLVAASGLWLTGFSAKAYLHNAAHDTRHSLNFPCH
ncbi:MAG: CbtB domain-containing protein [Alphaproteobacteria bacterium]